MFEIEARIVASIVYSVFGVDRRIAIWLQSKSLDIRDFDQVAGGVEL